jgi:hypothetical protein
MGTALHEGWAIVTFAHGWPLAGRLCYRHVQTEQYEWVLDVPACHRHAGYVATFDPVNVKSVKPCSEEEAVAFVNLPARLRDVQPSNPPLQPPAPLA